MFWNINEPLSYDALFNFIIGNRGSGKSYGAKEYAIKRYLKHGEQFIYVRRFKTELKKVGNYFNDIVDAFPNTKFDVHGKNFYIDDEICGYSVALSTAMIEKSTSYPKVSLIIFDEFLLDRGFHRYLPDEVTCFLELYETVARMRNNVRVLFLANAISFTNPYFLYFNITYPRTKKQIACKNDILIQFVDNPEFIQEKKQQRFSKIIEGTDYAKYSIDNEMLRDSDTFISKMPENSIYFFTIKSNGKFYGVWRDKNISHIFISEKYDPSYRVIYTTVLDDHTPNTMLLKGVARSENMKSLERAFKMGLVYFDSINTKNIMMETLKYLGG
jgi:hypothetical protein